jgi:hypothetical protein
MQISDTPWLVPRNPVDQFNHGMAWGNELYQNKLRTQEQGSREDQRQQENEIRKAEEARKAQVAAIRLSGYLDYQDDLKAAASDTPDGVVTPEIAQATFLKHGAKMTYDTPAISGFIGNADNRDLRQQMAAEANAIKERMGAENNATKADLEFERTRRANDVATTKADSTAAKSDADYRRVIDAVEKRLAGQKEMQDLKGGQAIDQIGAKGQNHIDAIDERGLWGGFDRAGKDGKPVSEQAFVDRHLNTVVRQFGVDESTAVKRLKEAYKSGIASKPKPQDPAPVDTSKVEQPKTKADYDALPPGATYLHPVTGKVQVKK